MAIVGDGKSNIYNFDSLEPYECLDNNFKRRIKPGTVDVITTNPPFGTKIDDTRDYVLEKYELGHKLINGIPTKTLLD
jgi:type I restriction enzyme M protein